MDSAFFDGQVPPVVSPIRVVPSSRRPLYQISCTPSAMRLLLFLLILGWLGSVFPMKNAGIFVRLNQKAVDYIADLASDAMPKLLNNLNPPDTAAGPAKTSKTLIHYVQRPEIDIQFLEHKGFRADILLPFIQISSDLQVNVFIFSYEGSFNAEMHNLTLSMEIHYSRNETTGRNVIEAPHCAVNHSELILDFPKDSPLATLRNEIETTIMDKLRSTFCEVAVQALQFVDDQNMEEAISEEAEIPLEGAEFSPAELGYSICQAPKVAEEPVTTEPPSSSEEVATTTLPTSNASWSANLSMAFPPVFRKDDVIVGINGGITFNGETANDVDMPETMFNRSLIDNQMIGIAVSEFVPNTLLAHIFDEGYGTFTETFTAEHLPKAIKKMGKMFCSKCYLNIIASLTERPIVQIDRHLGARVRVKANLTIKFQGRKDLRDLIHASTTMHITLKPTIRHSRIYGDVSLSSVDVNIFELSVSGALAKPLERVVSFIVPKVLWPQVKKRIRFAFNKRGFQLPVLCGVEFSHLHLSYVDHAAVLTTDFQFDLPMFVDKFKQYLQYKAQLNPGLPKYLDL